MFCGWWDWVVAGVTLLQLLNHIYDEVRTSWQKIFQRNTKVYFFHKRFFLFSTRLHPQNKINTILKIQNFSGKPRHSGGKNQTVFNMKDWPNMIVIALSLSFVRFLLFFRLMKCIFDFPSVLILFPTRTAFLDKSAHAMFLFRWLILIWAHWALGDWLLTLVNLNHTRTNFDSSCSIWTN